MNIEISKETVSRLSPRRRWFLIGVAFIAMATVLDALPGDLSLTVGVVALISMAVGILICGFCICNKMYEDFGGTW